jgi:TonB family protein
VRSSGVKLVDEAALAAVRQAALFPPLPGPKNEASFQFKFGNGVEGKLVD